MMIILMIRIFMVIIMTITINIMLLPKTPAQEAKTLRAAEGAVWCDGSRSSARAALLALEDGGPDPECLGL